VNWGASFPWKAVMPFENIFYLKNFRTFDLGASERTPFAYEVLHEYDISNLYSAIAENKSVYLIIGNFTADYLEYYLDFMQEHYHLTLTPKVQAAYMNFSLYQFSSDGI